MLIEMLIMLSLSSEPPANIIPTESNFIKTKHIEWDHAQYRYMVNSNVDSVVYVPRLKRDGSGLLPDANTWPRIETVNGQIIYQFAGVGMSQFKTFVTRYKNNGECLQFKTNSVPVIKCTFPYKKTTLE